MFERYTEKARRVIFFARYEASEFGSPEIQPEHLMLGLLRENRQLLIPSTEEARRLGQKEMLPEDLLHGLLRLEGSAVASLLASHGLAADALRQLRESTHPS